LVGTTLSARPPKFFCIQASIHYDTAVLAARHGSPIGKSEAGPTKHFFDILISSPHVVELPPFCT
jgi:hypothetical protein